MEVAVLVGGCSERRGKYISRESVCGGCSSADQGEPGMKADLEHQV